MGTWLLDLEEMRKLCGTEFEIITKHCLIRLEKRGISLSDVEYAIMNGEIIESYPDDYPFPSCLVFCTLLNQKPLHVVCSIGDGILYLITAYYPSLDTFESDYKTRRKDKMI